MLGTPLALKFVCHSCKHFGTWLYLTVQNPLYQKSYLFCLFCFVSFVLLLFLFLFLFVFCLVFVLFVLPVCLSWCSTCYHVFLSAVWPQCGSCRSYLLCYNTDVRSGHHPYWTHN